MNQLVFLHTDPAAHKLGNQQLHNYEPKQEVAAYPCNKVCQLLDRRGILLILKYILHDVHSSYQVTSFPGIVCAKGAATKRLSHT